LRSAGKSFSKHTLGFIQDFKKVHILPGNPAMRQLTLILRQPQYSDHAVDLFFLRLIVKSRLNMTGVNFTHQIRICKLNGVLSFGGLSKDKRLAEGESGTSIVRTNLKIFGRSTPADFGQYGRMILGIQP
jgi:hypothetical protein